MESVILFLRGRFQRLTGRDERFYVGMVTPKMRSRINGHPDLRDICGGATTFLRDSTGSVLHLNPLQAKQICAHPGTYPVSHELLVC